MQDIALTLMHSAWGSRYVVASAALVAERYTLNYTWPDQAILITPEK
jgi:hypothetical protein